jgi:signal transduction histidine kinase
LNVCDMLKHLKTEYTVNYPKENVQVVWDYPAEPVAFVTDSGKLKEILVNLINNALKFTNQGTVTVSLRLTEDHRRKWVELKVADTGCGIPKEQFPRIFDKFYQVDSSETRLYGGVGLGLYIVKHFTGFLGGEVAVDSEPAKGSTFTIKIPYAT